MAPNTHFSKTTTRYPALLALVVLAILLLLAGPVSGATVTTFYFDDTKNNLLNNPSGNQNFSVVRDGAGTSALDATSSCNTNITATATSLTYDYIYVCGLSANTASIPDTDIIDEAFITFRLKTRGNALGDPSLSVIDFFPEDMPFAATDFQKTTHNRLANDRAYAQLPTVNTYYSVNLTNTSIVSKTGNTTLMLTLNFVTDNTEPTWASGAQSYLSIESPVSATYKPSITIVHHSPFAVGNYSFVHFSDVQLQTKLNPVALNSYFDWIETNKDKYNITGAFVTGDLTQDGDNDTQWSTYITAKTHTTVPIYDSMGNHDVASYYSNWTGHTPYWCSTYQDQFIYIGTPNISQSKSAGTYDVAMPFISGTIEANPGKIPLIGTHSFLWVDGQMYHPASDIFNNVGAPAIYLSGHIHSIGWNRTYNKQRSILAALDNQQSTIGTTDMVGITSLDLYTVRFSGDGVDKIWRQHIRVYPDEIHEDVAEVYAPPDPAMDLSQWHDNFDDLTTYGYYTGHYVGADPAVSGAWEIQPKSNRLYTNDRAKSYTYNRATFAGGNYTVIYQPLAYDGSDRIGAGITFGKSSSAAESYTTGTKYTFTILNDSGEYVEGFLSKTINGVRTNLAVPVYTVNAGTTYPITILWDPNAATGNIKVYVNHILNASVNDTSIKSGYVGLDAWYSGGGAYFTKFSIEDIDPVVAFTATPTSGSAPLAVQFTDQSTSAATRAWSYSNVTGEWHIFSTAENPAYTFPAGVYDINLTITNSLGSDTETKTTYITAAPSGGYYVYIDSGTIYGKYPNGTVIAQGTAGTQDSAVIAGVVANATTGSSIYFNSQGAVLGNFSPEAKISIAKNLNFYTLGNATFLWNTGNSITDALFSISGSDTGTHNVIADVPIGATTLTVDSTTGFGEGDLVILYDSTIFNQFYSSTWKKAEIHKVQSVGTGTITLTDPTVMSYNYSVNGSKIQYIDDPVTVNMDGFYIYSTDASTNEHTAVFSKYLVDSTFTNMRINATGQTGIAVYNGYNVTVDGLTASNMEMSGQGYGVVTSDATAFVTIKNSNITTCRHAIANGGTGTSPGGQPRNVTVENNYLVGYLIAASHVLDAHSETFSMTVHNNTIIHPYDDLRAYAVSLSTKYLTFTNNTLVTNGTALRDRVSMANCTWIIQNNTFVTTKYGYYVQRYGYSSVLLSNDYSTWNYVYFHDNTISGGGALITVENDPVIALLDTDAIVPLAEISVSHAAEAAEATFTHRSFIKADSYEWNATNYNGTLSTITIGTTAPITNTFPYGNWSVNLTVTNEKGSNTSADVWVNVSSAPYIPTPAPVINISSLWDSEKSRPASIFASNFALISLLMSIVIIASIFGALIYSGEVKVEDQMSLALAIMVAIVIVVVCYYAMMIIGGAIAGY